MASPAHSTHPEEPEQGPGSTPTDTLSAQGAAKPCYCENRVCNCTPEVVAHIEAITAPEGQSTTFTPSDESDWPVMPFVTPLTYSDALTLVDEAIAETYTSTKWILLRDRLAHLLMTVDCESRKQGYVVTGGEEPEEVKRKNEARLAAALKETW